MFRKRSSQQLHTPRVQRTSNRYPCYQDAAPISVSRVPARHAILCVAFLAGLLPRGAEIVEGTEIGDRGDNIILAILFRRRCLEEFLAATSPISRRERTPRACKT